jgi:hypothetical protein
MQQATARSVDTIAAMQQTICNVSVFRRLGRRNRAGRPSPQLT